MRKAKGRKYQNKNIPKAEQYRSKAPKNENTTSITKTNQCKLSQYIKNYHKNKPGSFNPRAMNENALAKKIDPKTNSTFSIAED